jgi:carboxyl-terminal processing protease
MFSNANAMTRLILSVLFALTLSYGAAGQVPGPVTVGGTPADLSANEIRKNTFDVVWRTVRDKHFDPKFGGVDWEAVRARYEPRAKASASDRELYQILQEMLGELGQSHINIIPPEAVVVEEEKDPGGGIGVNVRMIENVAVLSRVEAESPAFRAGLRTGFIIQKIGDKTVEQLSAALANAGHLSSLRNVRITRRVLHELNGTPGTTVRITVLDEKNTTRDVSVVRERLKGELSPQLGNFPPQYTEFETARLDQNIGYIRFNTFTIPIIEKSKAALRELSDVDGLIIDLRGNPGGVGGIAMSIAGRLTEKPGSLGVMKLRSSEIKFTIFPQPSPYLGPVMILLDGLSGSTSEVFAGGMQEMARALVIGERSAGACLPSFFQKLPTGAIFQFAIADFKTPKGVLIEGRGVIPDVEVKWNRASLLAGRDEQLETAIGRLRQARRSSGGAR